MNEEKDITLQAADAGADAGVKYDYIVGEGEDCETECVSVFRGSKYISLSRGLDEDGTTHKRSIIEVDLETGLEYCYGSKLRFIRKIPDDVLYSMKLLKRGLINPDEAA